MTAAWSSRSEEVAGGRGRRVAVEGEGTPVSYADVLRLWREDAAFRSWFIELLVVAPFERYRWETPPITTATASRPFEFVLLDAPELNAAPSFEAFAKHFDAAALKRGVVLFPNLGRDALLVVPCPRGEASAYGHLAAFTRDAPAAQQHALWQLVGETLARRLNATPVWLSTAGAGVPWLHVRLDDRPKYYGYGPFRAISSSMSGGAP